MSSSDTAPSASLEQVVNQCLDTFYARKLKSLRSLTLNSLLLRKNPYLYRALGINDPIELIRAMLDAFISSSDETIFGKAFFEEIVLAYGKVRRSGIRGTDFIKETDTDYAVISLKSGPYAFSASQYDKQNADFIKVIQTLREQGIRKRIDLILGMSYGQIPPGRGGAYVYRILAGQGLWEELTGDPDFYIKLLDIIGDYSVTKRIAYGQEKSNVLARLTQEFVASYCDPDGTINWQSVVNVSSSPLPTQSVPQQPKRRPRKQS